MFTICNASSSVYRLPVPVERSRLFWQKTNLLKILEVFHKIDRIQRHKYVFLNNNIIIIIRMSEFVTLSLKSRCFPESYVPHPSAQKCLSAKNLFYLQEIDPV